MNEGREDTSTQKELKPILDDWSKLRPDTFSTHPKEWGMEDLKKLPPIPWHPSLEKLYKGTIAGDYRRGHEALLRLNAYHSGDTEALKEPSLLQPRFELLDKVYKPKDLIAVTTIFEADGRPSVLMMLENRSPSVQSEESVGKTTISETIVGLRPLDEILRDVIQKGSLESVKAKRVLSKVSKLSELDVPRHEQTNWKLLTGNMTYIGVSEEGQLVALPPVGVKEDWQWDLARSGVRRLLPFYDRYDKSTRQLQRILSEKIRIPSDALASNRQMYPVRWLVIVQREDFGEQDVYTQWGDQVTDATQIRKTLQEQLVNNPMYHTSGHWALNRDEHLSRVEYLTDSTRLTKPPERISYITIKGTKTRPQVEAAVSAIKEKSHTFT